MLLSDSLEEIGNNLENKNSCIKIAEKDKDKKNSNLNIIIERNTIKYNGRIFIYNHNVSKYQTKIKRKIYYCQYHSHMINKLQKKICHLFAK